MFANSLKKQQILKSVSKMINYLIQTHKKIILINYDALNTAIIVCKKSNTYR